MLIARDICRAVDPTAFARDCGIIPDPWQSDLLCKMPRRGLLLCSRQSGKTTVTALMAAHAAVYTPDSLVVIVSPSQRQSAEMLRTIRGLLANLDDAPEFDAESVLKMELANRSRILALPGTGDTIRGLASAKLVVIDESSRVDDTLLAAIRPMVAVSDGSIIALTTPAGKRGFFYEAWHSGDPIWHRVRVSAEQCPRISKQFLEEERKALGESRFQEEYMLAFLDSLESAFPTHIIDRAFTPEVRLLW